MTTINSLSAANAYRNQLKMMQGVQDTPDNSQQAAQSAFSQLVVNAASQASNSQYQSEALQLESLTGKVELSNLVTAVANAELSLQTVVAVRDRVISAYQDIIKMVI